MRTKFRDVKSEIIFMSDSVLKGIGARLAILRTEQAISQSALAKTIEMSTRAYQSYEAGIRGIPIEALIKLQKQYNYDINWILLGVEALKGNQDFDALTDIQNQIDAYIKEDKISIKNENRNAIISKWYKTIVNGEELTLTNIVAWIDLLKD